MFKFLVNLIPGQKPKYGFTLAQITSGLAVASGFGLGVGLLFSDTVAGQKAYEQGLQEGIQKTTAVYRQHFLSELARQRR